MYDDQQRTAPHASPGGRVFLHQFRHSTGRGPLISALIAGLLAIAVSAASLTFFVQYRSTAQAQIRLLQQAVSSAQQGAQRNASSIGGLSGKVSTIGGALNALAPFSMTCTQYLTGPGGGPATFYFPCSDVKP
jgi:hypothetical protein